MGSMCPAPTDPIPASVEALGRAVTALLKRERVGEDTRFYPQAEWQRRGEAHGNGAAATLTMEGPFNHMMNGHYGDADARRTVKRFYALVASLGYRAELGYAWTLHFYPEPEAARVPHTLQGVFDAAEAANRPRRAFVAAAAAVLRLAWNAVGAAAVDAARRTPVPEHLEPQPFGADDLESALDALERMGRGERAASGEGRRRLGDVWSWRASLSRKTWVLLARGFRPGEDDRAMQTLLRAEDPRQPGASALLVCGALAEALRHATDAAWATRAEGWGERGAYDKGHAAASALRAASLAADVLAALGEGPDRGEAAHHQAATVAEQALRGPSTRRALGAFLRGT